MYLIQKEWCKMKKNKTLITIGIVFLVGAITRRMLNSIGGIKSLPYLLQIIIMILVPAILFIVAKKERKKMNSFQYRLCRLFIIFFSIMAGLLCIIIVLNNSAPLLWKQYKTIFQVLTPSLFLTFSIYMGIITLHNIKK